MRRCGLKELAGRRNPVDAHVRAQNVREQDGAIGLLIIFDDGYPGATDREARTVQRVDELALAARFWLEANSGTARLKGFAVRTGRNFTKFVARRQPDFKVVGFRGSKAHIAGGKQHGAVVQPKFLENGLRVSCERLVLFVTFSRMRELEELDFLELVLAENAARVFSGGAGFGAEAGGPGGHENRQLFLRNRFIAIKIVQLDFGSGREPEVAVFYFEEVGGEFGQLARSHERGGVDQKRGKNLRVAVLTRVNVEKKIGESALKPGAPSFINGETRAGDLCGGRQIQNVRAFAYFPMGLRLEIKFWGSTPAADFHIVRGACANGHRRVRKIGNREKQVALGSI